MKTLTTKPTSFATSAGAGLARSLAAVDRSAFTRVELSAGLAAVALLGVLALPALATGQSRGQGAQCLNNLRLVGRAVEMFASDHVGQPSWRTYTTDGGTRPTSGTKPGAAWFEFAALSNELATPRILACPADTGVKVAAEFSNNGASGFMSTGFRSMATSYFLTLDNIFNNPAWPLFGDRNLRFNGLANCVNGINNADRLSPFFTGQAEWTNAVHGLQGNIVRLDGGVHETSGDQMRAILRAGISDDFSLHFLRAR